MSLFTSLSVSASGMSAQRTRAELLVENLANSETTRTPEGGPYRRKDAVFAAEEQHSPFASVFQQVTGTGVGVDEITVDQRDPDAFADAVRRLLADPVAAARMGSDAARRAKGYTWSTAAARLRRVYADLASRSLVDCAA